ncbi:MAG: Sec-independent protein translocase subunit TatA/TatB, partial [Planctomycetota bacterium]
MVPDLLHCGASTLAWMPSGPEWIVVLVIGLLLFGRKLPEIGRSLGQGIRQFKSGLNEVTDQVAGQQAHNPYGP